MLIQKCADEIQKNPLMNIDQTCPKIRLNI